MDTRAIFLDLVSYTEYMRKNITGFTLVELIIVISIIGLLATLGIVSYQGIMTMARTSQSTAAAEQWLKALQTYRVRNSGYPTISGCLGAHYNYNVTNDGSSGTGQCRQSGANGIKSSTALNDALAKYITGQPTPAFVTGSNSTSVWSRGLYYTVTTSAPLQRSQLVLTVDGTNCPKLNNLTASNITGYSNSKSACTYDIGLTTGY